MTADGEKTEQVEALLATPDLAGALESEQFRHFFDQVPIAIVVSEMKGHERIAYPPALGANHPVKTMDVLSSPRMTNMDSPS